jgi:dihydrofolate reductase
MRKLTLYMTMTFDGFFARPNDELDWMVQTPDPELTADTVSYFDAFDEGFIGYPSGVGMIAYWRTVLKNPSTSEHEQAIAKAVNKLHPILVSNRPEKLLIDNAELLVARDDDELRSAVTRIKGQSGRDLGLPGGIRTAQKFVRLDLVDEYVIMVHPVTIGNGKRVFTNKTNLELVNVKTYQSGVMRICYKSR